MAVEASHVAHPNGMCVMALAVSPNHGERTAQSNAAVEHHQVVIAYHGEPALTVAQVDVGHGVCTPLGGQTPAAAVGHRAGSGAQGTDYLHGSEGLVRLLADPRET